MWFWLFFIIFLFYRWSLVYNNNINKTVNTTWEYIIIMEKKYFLIFSPRLGSFSFILIFHMVCHVLVLAPALTLIPTDKKVSSVWFEIKYSKLTIKWIINETRETVVILELEKELELINELEIVIVCKVCARRIKWWINCTNRSMTSRMIKYKKKLLAHFYIFVNSVLLSEGHIRH